MKTARIILAVLLVLGCVAFQSVPAPIPPFEGDGNAEHDGQPKWCQSHDDTHVHNCACKARCDAGENPRCAVYCRKQACKCKSPCQTE